MENKLPIQPPGPALQPPCPSQDLACPQGHCQHPHRWALPQGGLTAPLSCPSRGQCRAGRSFSWVQGEDGQAGRSGGQPDTSLPVLDVCSAQHGSSGSCWEIEGQALKGRNQLLSKQRSQRNHSTVRLEKPSEITKSRSQPSTAIPITKPRPQVLHPHVLNTFRDAQPAATALIPALTPLQQSR